MNKTDLDSLIEVEVWELAPPWFRGMPVSPTRPPFRLTLTDTGRFSDIGSSVIPACRRSHGTLTPWPKAKVKVSEVSIHRDVA